MKRYPNGIAGQWFYQHRVDDVPAGVRTELVRGAESREQIVGGSLKTLLYTTQLAAISQDPWFSRVDHPESADHIALDLDPSEGVPFGRVLDVARWIRDELATLGASGVAKTSGASGLHVFVPLPPGTPYDAALLFAQIIATVVAQKQPKIATIERSVRARGARVYVDVLQNILGGLSAAAAGLLIATGIRLLMPHRRHPAGLLLAALAFAGMAFTKLPLPVVLLGLAPLGIAVAAYESAGRR